MAASREDIAGWLEKAKSGTATCVDGHGRITHVIVVCDTYDHDDYPVYVGESVDVNERYEHYRNAKMQRVMEVYSMNRDIDAQLSENRAWHFD